MTFYLSYVGLLHTSFVALLDIDIKYESKFSMTASYLGATANGVDIAVHAQPRASRSKISGEHDGRLKVHLAAPPVDGEANDALVTLLADLLQVPRRQVTVVAGQTGRRKVVRVQGLTLDQVAAALTNAPKTRPKNP